MSEPSTARSGGLGGSRRTPRMSNDAVKTAMLDAAQKLVEEAEGLTVSLDHLSYEEVIGRAGAYRIWPYKEGFHVDLLCALAGPSWQGTAAFDEETIKRATKIVTGNIDRLHTPEGRRQVLREAVRVAALQNYSKVIGSAQWRTYVAITATLLSSVDGEVKDKVLSALREAEESFIDKMSVFYDDMLLLLGLRLREPFDSSDLLAALGAAVVEGMALRNVSVPELVSRTFQLPGLDGPAEWSLPAVGFMAILDDLVEPQPAYSVETAFAEYQERLDKREEKARKRSAEEST